jgi:hypothetical protein
VGLHSLLGGGFALKQMILIDVLYSQPMGMPAVRCFCLRRHLVSEASAGGARGHRGRRIVLLTWRLAQQVLKLLVSYADVQGCFICFTRRASGCL